MIFGGSTQGVEETRNSLGSFEDEMNAQRGSSYDSIQKKQLVWSVSVKMDLLSCFGSSP